VFACGGRDVAVGHGVSVAVGQELVVLVGRAVRVGSTVGVGVLTKVGVPVGTTGVAVGRCAINVGLWVAVGRSEVGQNGRAPITVGLSCSSRRISSMMAGSIGGIITIGHAL
jgi:hypothetical protein